MNDPSHPAREYDLAIVGAGAAGLFASIWAGRVLAASTSPDSRPACIIALDGAKKLGAKILVAGGGRCNVTHHRVDESAYAGSSRHAVRKVLGRFDVDRTVEFFNQLGVTLKREDTGKLFPTTDDAHTVLDALLNAAADAGVELRHPWRVGEISRTPDGRFAITRSEVSGTAPDDDTTAREPVPSTAAETLVTHRVILATGGMALPKSGSDGAGYAFARTLGHTVTERVFPALVPLIVHESSFIRALSGLTLPTTLSVHSGASKRLASFTNSTLCTHFGLSGPGPLDISRYYFDARAADPGATLVINWLPTTDSDALSAAIAGASRMPVSVFLDRRPHHLPSRLLAALLTHADVDPQAPCDNLPRAKRLALAASVCAMPVPVTGSRGYTYAEVTAGGVPLSELRLESMESRVCPGLHVIGELCDVDGRIGGFNFQWAWASGFVAGTAAAATLQATSVTPPASAQ